MSATLLPQVTPPPPPEGVDDLVAPTVPDELAAYRRRFRRRLFCGRSDR